MTTRRRPGPAPTGVTPHRTIRVPDDLWQQAAQIARDNGETLSDVTRRALAAYVRRHRKGQS